MYINIINYILTYIFAGLSPAVAIAGSKCILQGLPWSCRNCVGSDFYKKYKYIKIKYIREWKKYAFVVNLYIYIYNV